MALIEGSHRQQVGVAGRAREMLWGRRPGVPSPTLEHGRQAADAPVAGKGPAHVLTSALSHPSIRCSASFAALAGRERELAAAQRRAAELEAEVSDLERECQLRQTQVGWDWREG